METRQCSGEIDLAASGCTPPRPGFDSTASPWAHVSRRLMFALDPASPRPFAYLPGIHPPWPWPALPLPAGVGVRVRMRVRVRVRVASALLRFCQAGVTACRIVGCCWRPADVPAAILPFCHPSGPPPVAAHPPSFPLASSSLSSPPPTGPCLGRPPLLVPAPNARAHKLLSPPLPVSRDAQWQWQRQSITRRRGWIGGH